MSSISEKRPAAAIAGTTPNDRSPAAVAAPAYASSLGDEGTRELEQLRDRFRKTTNALASAAHDLKTPLAILNGYIELLRSQKLGPLNERQREVMADMFSSGQRLQQFIQAVFLSHTGREYEFNAQFLPLVKFTPLIFINLINDQ